MSNPMPWTPVLGMGTLFLCFGAWFWVGFVCGVGFGVRKKGLKPGQTVLKGYPMRWIGFWILFIGLLPMLWESRWWLLIIQFLYGHPLFGSLREGMLCHGLGIATS